MYKRQALRPGGDPGLRLPGGEHDLPDGPPQRPDPGRDPGHRKPHRPVSYTHLDVYKRQIECLRSPNYNLKKKDTPNVYFAGNGLSSEALEEILDLGGEAVAGEVEDVYKRQEWS